MALNNGATNAALALCDQAIAADPRLVDAWMMKADCLEGDERVACLKAALTVNPGSQHVQRALDRTGAAAQARR
jgi:hypothetical protein